MIPEEIDKSYIKNGADQTTEKDLEEMLDNEESIEDKFRNSGVLNKYFEISKMMFKMANDYIKGDYKKVPWFTIATIVFTLLYVLNPLDLIPDFIPIVGYLDDVSVLAIGLNLIQTDLHEYIKWKDQQEED